MEFGGRGAVGQKGSEGRKKERLFEIGETDFASMDLFGLVFFVQVSSGICQMENNVRHQLTLTNCEGGQQFTCDDGTCVR